MANSFIIYTNNELVFSKYSQDYDVDYSPVSYVDLLKKVRDAVHKGAKLLTHPLSGSIKPNETPFKSVYLTKAHGKMDLASLEIIENAIETTKKFPIKYPNMPQHIQDDFALIDLSLVDSALSAAIQS